MDEAGMIDVIPHPLRAFGGLTSHPTIVLLNAPSFARDAALRSGMGPDIRNRHERLETTMIHVTYDRVEAMTAARESATFRTGKTIAAHRNLPGAGSRRIGRSA